MSRKIMNLGRESLEGTRAAALRKAEKKYFGTISDRADRLIWSRTVSS